MDLLGDLGQADQLTSARAENKVLQNKVKELNDRVRVLSVQNQSLLAEVEEYRREHATLGSGARRQRVVGGAASANDDDGGNGGGGAAAAAGGEDDFVTSGNGIYPDTPTVTLPNLHGISNLLTCSLHPSATLIATGGADSYVSLCQWGGALSPAPDAVDDTVRKAARVRCDAPVISVAFALPGGEGGTAASPPLVAAGCMDGSVRVIEYGRGGIGGAAPGVFGARAVAPSSSSSSSSSSGANNNNKDGIKLGKYVKCVAWSPSAPILAAASADGTVQLTKIGFPREEEDGGEVDMELVQTMHLPGAVEAMCFVDNGDTLVCYSRETSYLSYFDLKDGCKQTRFTVNESGVKGFEDHVSFTIMDLVPSPDGKYLAAATDTSRNIIFEVGTSRQIRNLYGHKNDGYSQPKLAWSANGQYVLGNTQDDNSICVWDVASSSIVRKLDGGGGGHSSQIRGIFSSPTSDTMVSASFDKTAKIWLRGDGV